MRDGDAPARRPGRFDTTRWSLVVAAGHTSNADAAEALSHLCELYWYPVYAFIRRQGLPAEDAADLTQEFFARLLEKNYLHDADPARGRFRAFLCGSIQHFLSNERDRAQTQKRGGTQPPLSLDRLLAEGTYGLEPLDDRTPETLFDREWALTLIDRVLTRVRDHQMSIGRGEIFDRLKGSLTGDGTGVPHADVARTLGMTEGAVRVAVHRLRRQFRDTLIGEIAHTVSDPADINAEIAYLLRAVRA